MKSLARLALWLACRVHDATAVYLVLEVVPHTSTLRLLLPQIKKAELNSTYVSEVERGRVNISLDSLIRIAKALRVRVRDLIADI